MKFDRVSPGDKLRIPAATWNAVLEAALAYRSGRLSQASESAIDTHRPTITVLARNDAEGDLGLGAQVYLQSALVDVATNLSEWQHRCAYSFNTVADGQGDGAMGLTAEPIAKGQFGRVAIAGIATARMTIHNVAHRHARVETDTLCSSWVGPHRIVTPPSATGTQWVKLLLYGGIPVGQTFAVKVSNPTGTNGTATTPATYVYTVKDLSGQIIGTSVPVALPRPAGKVIAQTDGYGLAFYDGTTLYLADAGEVPYVTTCPT